MKVLFIDACMRPDEISRTKALCNVFLDALKERGDCEIETVALKDMDLKPYTYDMVEARYALLEAKAYDDPTFDLARQFSEADRVVLAAPYWDLAFPAVLKIYIEHIFVAGINFKGTEHGLVGLAKGEKALFIQSAGAPVAEDDPEAMYLKHVMQVLGIPEFRRIGADGVDAQGADIEGILAKAKAELKELAATW
ncbi:MAG: NAD(P)H-dependent oxidoreductase [Firmicutes bacterium]|nr:NAD(P)H-dependent oxidoreductase [Bacillota bacterium]